MFVFCNHFLYLKMVVIIFELTWFYAKNKKINMAQTRPANPTRNICVGRGSRKSGPHLNGSG